MATAGQYFRTPPVVKNLLIINFIVFLAEIVFQKYVGGTPGNLTSGNPLVFHGSLRFAAGESLLFYLANSYQLVTYMFLHGSFGHMFFNMFALWMFGRILEYDLGSRRFFFYYMICGIGSGLIQLGVNWAEYAFWGGPSYALTLGASGAIFGVLIGFAMFRPNEVILLLFPPIPMKAKWFVVIYGAIELFAGFSGTGGNVAHFAHVGGLLVGFLLLRYWRSKRIVHY